MPLRLRSRQSLIRAVLLATFVLVVEFVVLELALRAYGGSEASSSFQSLFTRDPRIGHLPKPGARATYTTTEFSTDIAINQQGVRDDEDLGPKAPGERRIVIVGDSLVFAVQVPFATTFGEQLEAQLNASHTSHRWRVINAGVQGYGPVEEALFFDHVVARFEPDIVLVVVFVGNDAVEAGDSYAKLTAGGLPATVASVNALRATVRRSQVLQLARVRVDQLRARFNTGTPERPLASYLDDAPVEVVEGFNLARQVFARIVDRARDAGAVTDFVLMPARFQTDDGDYGRLAQYVASLGGTLQRHLATTRFQTALAPLDRPVLDLLPTLSAQEDRAGLFFQRTVHLTPRGHEVVARALFDFLETHELANVGPD